MKPHHKILVIWAAWAVFLFVAAGLGIGSYPDLSSTSLNCVEALLALLAIVLLRNEYGTDKKMIFLNFALCFGLNGFLVPICYFFVMQPLLEWCPYSDFYFYQYETILYVLLLTLSVVYIVLSVILSGKTYKTSLISLSLAAGISFCVFYPYLQNPNYLYTKPDVIDYFAVRNTLENMGGNSKSAGNVAALSAYVKLYAHTGSKTGSELEGKQKEERIAEFLPYIESSYPAVLFYRPLYLNCAYLAIISIVFLLFFVVFCYVKNPPAGAYLEKMVWLLLPYCILEGLHFYIYTLASSDRNFEAIQQIGWFLSLAVMVGLLLLFALRLRFLLSVEGRFYERTLARDSQSITRWRDPFDNWLLREFMNPDGLNHRFLLRRKMRT